MHVYRIPLEMITLLSSPLAKCLLSCRASARTTLHKLRSVATVQASTMSGPDAPVQNVLFIIAMQAEAEPIVEELGLKKDEESP